MTTKKFTGFARLDREVVRQFASEGGKKGHTLGLSRQWSPEEAREAAKKSAEVRKRRKEESQALREIATDNP